MVCYNWISRVAHNHDGLVQKYKTGLVAKDSQQTYRMDYFEVFSLIVKVTTIRFILSLIFYGSNIKQIYINKSFLIGELEDQKKNESFV